MMVMMKITYQFPYYNGEILTLCQKLPLPVRDWDTI